MLSRREVLTAVGGYGCFGIVYSLVLRLTRRRVVERVVEERSIEGLDRAFAERIEAGFLFGDFQFKTDDKARDFLQTGVFACYRPVEGEVSALKEPRRLSRSRWQKLLELALAEGGSYFLTYHRWATRSQVETAYRKMPEFLRRKLEWDPDERFQSDWYRHYRDMFADRL